MKINLPWLVNTLLLLGTAAICTFWVLRWTSGRPPQEPVVAVPVGNPVALTQALNVAPAARLFGDSPGSISNSNTSLRIRLDGVIADGGQGRGVALLSVNGQPSAAYRAGETIGADHTLDNVHKDRVVIRTPLGMEEIRLPSLPPPRGIEPAP